MINWMSRDDSLDEPTDEPTAEPIVAWTVLGVGAHLGAAAWRAVGSGRGGPGHVREGSALRAVAVARGMQGRSKKNVPLGEAKAMSSSELRAFGAGGSGE